MFGEDGLRLGIDQFYERSNEHIIGIAKLFYLANYQLTAGDNIGLIVIVCIFSVLIAALLAIVISRSTQNLTESVVAGVVVAIFAFTPLAAHNYFLGMSGVAWIGANLFTICAAFAFWRAIENEWPFGYVLAVLFALIAAHAYSTGLVAICVLGIQGLAFAKTRRIGAALFALGLIYVFIIYLLQQVPEYIAERATDPIQIALFCITFIGGGLTSSNQGAFTVGLIGVLVLIPLAWRQIFREGSSNLAAFWIAISAYALMNSGLGAIGRANMGGETAALASRYATIPALFWVSLFGLVISTPEVRKVRLSYRASFLLALVAVISVIWAGTSRVDAALTRASGKDLASLALSLGVKDDQLITQICHSNFFPVLRHRTDIEGNEARTV